MSTATAAVLRARRALPITEEAGPFLVHALLGAGQAVVLGLGPLLALSLLSWAAAGSVGSSGTAVQAAVEIWLAAQRTPLHLPTGEFTLAPLGLTVVLAWLLYRTGRRAATSTGATGAEQLGQSALVAAAVTASYALLAAAVAIACFAGFAGFSGTGTDGVAVASPGQALLGAGTLALFASGTGVLTATSAFRTLLAKVPVEVGCVLRSTAVALAVLTAGAGATIAGGVVTHFNAGQAALQELHGGAVGGALLTLVGLVYLPTAVVWAVAYLLGPGFAVGTDSAVALGGTHLGALPGLPFFTALPGYGPAPTWMYALYAVPALAGAAAGVLAVRRCPYPADHTWVLGAGLATGVATGGVVGVAAGLARGALADGRLALLGPDPLEVALAAAAEVAVAAVVAGVVTTGVLRWRRGAGRPAEAEPVPEPEPVP